MSKFIKFESYLMPPGSLLVDVHNRLKNTLVTECGWRLVNDSRDFFITKVIGNHALKEKAFDGTLSTYADQAGFPGSAKWLGVTLNQPKEIIWVGLIIFDNTNHCVRSFTVDWSDDEVNWNTVDTFTDVIWDFDSQRQFFPVTPSGAHKHWRVNATASWSSNIRFYQIEFYDASLAPAFFLDTLTTRSYFDVIPPVTEVIGDDKARGVVRFEFTQGSSQSIEIRPIYQTLKEHKSTLCIWGGTAGAVQHSISILGETIRQDPSTVNATNSAAFNIRHLFIALKNATTPIASKFKWKMEKGGIYGTFNDIGFKLAMKGAITSSTGVLFNIINDYIPSMWRNPFYTSYKHHTVPSSGATLPIDLSSGFVYYFQICARGLALAIKTNSGFSSPIHACYSDNTKAKEATPKTEHASAIELVVGYMHGDKTDFTKMRGVSTHSWAIHEPGVFLSKSNIEGVGHPASRLVQNAVVQDCMKTENGSTNDWITDRIVASRLWAADSTVGKSYQIHRMSMNCDLLVNSSQAISGGPEYAPFLPSADFDDWYKYASKSTVANESLVLVVDGKGSTTLVSPTLITPEDTINSFEVASVKNLAMAGQIMMNGEVFSYQGISGKTLTGVTRGTFVTLKTTHCAGDTVQPCFWCMIVGGSALLCGPVKPS